INLCGGGGGAEIIIDAEIFQHNLGSRFKTSAKAAPGVLSAANISGIQHDRFGNPFQCKVAMYVGCPLPCLLHFCADKGGFGKFGNIEKIFAAQMLVPLSVI